MERKALSCIMVTLLLIIMSTSGFNFQSAKASPEAKVYVDPSACGCAPSDSFSVDINVADVDDLYAWEFYLSWDTAILDVAKVEEGPFLNSSGDFSSFFVSRMNNTEGWVYAASTLVGVGAQAAPSGNGTLATVTFYIKAAGGTALRLYDTNLLDFNFLLIPHTVEDGYFSTSFPAALFTYSPKNPSGGDIVTFNASDSYDYDGSIETYSWNFGDGNVTTGPDSIVEHNYAKGGTYKVILTVTDNESNSTSRIKYVRFKITVPIDYPTIQDAVDAAVPGDSLFVKSGTYAEDVTIMKSRLTLVGEAVSTTVVNGSITILASSVLVQGLTVQNGISSGDPSYSPKNIIIEGNIVSGSGVFMYVWSYYSPYSVFTNYTIVNNVVTNSTRGIYLLGGGTNNTIRGNTLSDNEIGLVLDDFGNNTIVDNTISHNTFGFLLDSSHNLLRNNAMQNNQYNFLMSIWSLASPRLNDVDTSNTVNGKPIHILTDESNMVINPSSFPNIGYLALINCYNVTVQDLALSNNGEGILVSNSVNITLQGNTFRNNMLGIKADFVNNATIEGNTVRDNLHGVFVGVGVNNTIADNTLMNNTLRSLPYHWPDKWPYVPKILYWIENELLWYSGGIYLYASQNSTIANNVMMENEHGIYFAASSFNTFRNNTMTDNVFNFGIDPLFLIPSGWAINPPAPPQISPFLMNDVETSNTVDGKPIYWWINRHDEHVPLDAGYVILVNSTNMIVKDLTLQNNEQGILLFDTTNSEISNNNITDTRYGILTRGYLNMDLPTNVTITENNVTRNGVGIEIGDGSLTASSNILKNNLAGIYVRTDNNILSRNALMNNTYPPWEEWSLGWAPSHVVWDVWAWHVGGIGILIEATNNTLYFNTFQYNDFGISIGLYSRQGGNKIYHNNFIDNLGEHVEPWYRIDPIPQNTWDNGYPSGGNYWSGYTGVDQKNGQSQNQPGSDGIGDTPYPINANNTDKYPLICPLTPFDAGTWNDIAYNIDVVSNSTVSEFRFIPEDKLISFNVTGEEGTRGFCRVAIPKELLWVYTPGDWIVKVGDSLVSPTVSEDDNYSYLCFTYDHSTKTVLIIGAEAVPEFPLPMILLVLVAFIQLGFIFAKTRPSRKPKP